MSFIRYGQSIEKGKLVEDEQRKKQVATEKVLSSMRLTTNQSLLLFKSAARRVDVSLMLDVRMGYNSERERGLTIKEHNVLRQQALLNNFCFQNVSCQCTSSSIGAAIVLGVWIGCTRGGNYKSK